MPIYDYLCSSCGHRTEVIHGINEAGPRFCPNCGAEGTLRKGISTPAILYRGSGWAKKDRAATRKPAAAPSTGDAASGTDAAAGDTSPAKTDAGSTASPASSGTGGD